MHKFAKSKTVFQLGFDKSNTPLVLFYNCFVLYGNTAVTSVLLGFSAIIWVSNAVCNRLSATVLNELACEYICAGSLMYQSLAGWNVGKKASTKAPKIQRLVTPLVLQRKRHRLAQKRRRATKKREEAAEYQKLLAQRLKEAKERKLERRRTASHSKSSMTRTDSTSSAGKKWTLRVDYR